MLFRWFRVERRWRMAGTRNVIKRISVNVSALYAFAMFFVAMLMMISTIKRMPICIEKRVLP